MRGESQRVTSSYNWLDNRGKGVTNCWTSSDTYFAHFKLPLHLPFSQTILNQFVLRTPFPAHTFTVRSVNESHVMCCFVIVQLNSSWRQHTPVFSSPLRRTGHNPSHVVPLPLPTVLPSSHSPCLSKHKLSYKSSPLRFLTRLPPLRSHSREVIINLCDVIINDNCIEWVIRLSPCLSFSVIPILLLFLIQLPVQCNTSQA